MTKVLYAARLEQYVDKEGGACAYLLSMLRGCAAQHPCNSGACPHCAAELQEAALAVVEQYINEPSHTIRGRRTGLTIVPCQGIVAPGELTADDLERVKELVQTALRDAQIGRALGQLEVSYNTDQTREVPDYWSVHAHVTILDWVSKAQLECLKKHFPPCERVRVPLDPKKLDRRSNWDKYALKPQRFARESYVDHPTNGRPPSKNTRSRPLPPERAVELALVENQFGLLRRLLIHGIPLEAVEGHFVGFKRVRDGP